MAAVLHRGDCYNIENVLVLCQIPEEKIRLASGNDAGFPRTVASYLASIAERNDRNLLGNSPLERAEVDQWVEFGQTKVEASTEDNSALKSVLMDMDSHLSNRVYLVGDSLTLADVTTFYSLHGHVTNWSCKEKEQHINISRWFRQLQSLPEVRQHLMEVQFHRNVLYS